MGGALRALAAGLGVAALVWAVPALAGISGHTGDLTPQVKPVWLTHDQVARFLAPGAFWCFEPKDNTCIFAALSKGEEDGRHVYDVIEMWTPASLLTTHTSGVLMDDGTLCERNADYVDNIDLVNWATGPAGPDRLAEITAGLRAAWGDDALSESCFRYMVSNPASPEMISQFRIVDGRPSGEPLEFIMDYEPGAEERFTLRFE